MSDPAMALVLVMSMAMMYYIGVAMGKKDGIKVGLRQAEVILARAIQIRVSPTARQALICIVGNCTQTEMEEELYRINDRSDRGGD